MITGTIKNNDPPQIYDVISQRVFPAVKNLKYGRLPDFTEQGEMIEIEDDPGKPGSVEKRHGSILEGEPSLVIYAF